MKNLVQFIRRLQFVIFFISFIFLNLFSQEPTEYSPLVKPIKNTDIIKIKDGPTFLLDVDGSGLAEITDIKDIEQSELSLPPEVWKVVWKYACSDPFQVINFAQKFSKAMAMLLSNEGGFLTTQFSSDLNSWSNPDEHTSILGRKFERFLKILGDDIYILSTSFVYKSTDKGSTWQIDSTGIGGEYAAKDIALDTAQNVWAATSTGLFFQAANSNIWQKHATFPISGYLNSVFVDKRNRVFVGSNTNGLYRSINGGVSWLHDTATIGTRRFKKFTDDAFGNIYALASSGGFLYRSSDAGTTWSRIGIDITSLSADTLRLNIINDITADINLYAGTAFGLFFSTNQGTSWIEANHGPRSKVAYGFIKLPNGRKLISTDAGFFYKSSSDKDWIKSYPVKGYMTGSQFWIDSTGEITILAQKTGQYAPPLLVLNSDDGIIWNPDTLGLSIINKMSSFGVDETGEQHLSSSLYGQIPTLLYSKKKNLSWGMDTNGFKSSNSFDIGLGFCTDGQNLLFHYGKYAETKVWHRPINGGTWIPDESGLNGDTISLIVSNKKGILVGSSISKGLYKHYGGVWNTMLLPSGLSESTITAISFDSQNTLWAAFSVNQIPKGVFHTNAYGTSWTFSGLDSITVNTLSSFADTVYALTRSGIFKLSKPQTNSYDDENHENKLYNRMSYCYPNPANNTFRLKFANETETLVQINIYDCLGNEVLNLTEYCVVGTNEKIVDCSRLSTGYYLVKVSCGASVETQGLLIIK
ncbi:MAG: T9SS type A sorting domain-containing protein [Bacteroidota bacterium]